MTKIFRATNPNSPRTPRHVGATSANRGTEKWSGSFHDAAQKISRVTSKLGVRVLRANPNTAVKDMSSEFTNNPNPKFDPSRAPGAVAIKKVSRPSVGATSGTHQKVFKPNRQTLFGGKTLRRKQF